MDGATESRRLLETGAIYPEEQFDVTVHGIEGLCLIRPVRFWLRKKSSQNSI